MALPVGEPSPCPLKETICFQQSQVTIMKKISKNNRPIRIAPKFRIWVILVIMAVALVPGVSMAAPQELLSQEHPDWDGLTDEANRLSPEDRAALKQGQPIEVIIEFDQTEAANLATAQRQQAALDHDDEAILAERVKIYRRQKDQTLAALAAEPAAESFKVKTDYSHLPMIFAQVGSSKAMNAFLRQPDVKAVHSNLKLRRALVQSLPLIRQPETAAQGGAGTGVTVAVLDSGVDYTRAAFGSCAAPGGACKVVYARDFAPDDGLRDDDGHGTNVAGIVLGVAPGAQIAALDVFDGELASSSHIIAAIDWVIANRNAYNIVAVNLSLGGRQYYSPCSSDVFATPIANARAAGILASVASGNQGYKDSMGSPACAPEAVSVGAVYDANQGPVSWRNCTDNTTQADKITCFSNSASFLTLLAPGALIDAAGLTQGGTSQAAPHVAGAIAVLRAAYPNESVDATIARLINTGVRITDSNDITKPRIDLLAAYTANRTAYALRVNRAGSGSGVVRSNPTGIDCGGQCSAEFVSGATVNLTATPDAGSTFAGWSGACTGTGGCSMTMNSALEVTATFDLPTTTLSLGEALDNTTLNWSTTGNAGWQGAQLSDRDAARSGAISHNQTSVLSTSITEPGILGFQWKVSSEPGYDYLEFRINDILQFRISGETGWEPRTINISAGVHQLQWIYRKDGSISRGEDAGWVDAVTFTPTQINQPELVVAQVTGPAHGTPGGRIEVSATVQNQGSVAASSFRVSFLLSRDSTITLQDIDTGWGCSFDRLSGGATGTCSGEIGIPADVPLGTYYLGAYADSQRTVEESDETNNGRAADNPIILSSGTFPLAVTLEGSGTGKISSNPAGIDCGLRCSANFTTGAVVTLTATPEAGSTFMGWSGACTGAANCVVTMSAARNVTATFDAASSEQFPPNGAWPAGWTAPATSDADWFVTTDWASEGRFSLRSGRIGDNQKSQVQISGNFQAGTVSFTRRVSSERDYDWLSFYIDGVEQNGWSGETGLDGAVTTFPLTAGYHTLLWSYEKDGSISAGSDAAWIDGVSLPPLSGATTYALTVNKTGTGNGTVTSSPAGIHCGLTCSANFTSGTPVTLTASADGHSVFRGWSGACTGAANCVVTMSAARNVTATFDAASSEQFPPNGAWPTNWTTPVTSDADWFVTTDWASEGRVSLRSGPIGDNQKSQVQISGNFQAGTVSFTYRVSSERDYDWLSFYIDGVEQNGWSGETATAGTRVSFPVTAGQRTLLWSYEKDGSIFSGSDAAWIDDVSLPQFGGSDPATTLITHYYVSILRRSPDAGGLAYWQQLIAQKQQQGLDVKPVFRDMANFFFNSPEYLGRNTTDTEFVTNLYLTFFQRNPDSGGMSFWLNQLALGVSRNQVMSGFLYSPEFTHFMQSLGF